MTTSRLNEKSIALLAAPTSGHSISYDSDVKGFGLRITTRGVKSFILNYHINGRERRLTIGQHPAWTTSAAREQAKRLKRAVDTGNDPLGERKSETEAATIRHLWGEYQAHHLASLAPRSQADIRSMWKNYILPTMGAQKVKNVTASQVDKLHLFISATAKIRANRVVENFRSALAFAERWGWIATNPADSFKRNREDPRELYLTEAEVRSALRFIDEIENQQAANVIRLLILTGARVGEVLNAAWDHFDLDTGVWTKPSSATKQRRVHRTPLSPEANSILSEMKVHARGNLLFPSANGRPISDIKRPWNALRRHLKQPKLRVHDLRHTYASFLASSGVNLPTIGKLLGHSQTQTTSRYVHLFDDPLRAATSKVGSLFSQRK